MRIALVHDYIKEYGGAERVLEALHEIWPDAPVFTTVYLPEFLGPHNERFRNWNIKTSFLQYIPFKEKLISPFRIISPFVFKTFDFSQYDIVIVSATGAYLPNTIKVKSQKSKVKTTRFAEASARRATQNSKLSRELKTNNQRPIHVCYCHTPPRYLYGYATAREWKKNLALRVFGEIGNHFLRLIDFKSAQNVDYFIANSKNVGERIKKFYRKEAEIIYPPVDIGFAMRSLRQFGDSSDSNLKQSINLVRANASQHGSKDSLFKSAPHAKAPRAKSEYFLAGGRLARPKHIDLIVRACQELKVPLKVFGRTFADALNISVSLPAGRRGQYPNIQVLGEVSDEEKLELMKNAKAYIFAAEDEDFGITPVEAMMVGTPVIAYRSGGVVESIINGKTGIFFDELTVESLSRAIQQFNRVKRDNAINPSDCISQAQKFSKEKFKKEIKEFVESKL